MCARAKCPQCGADLYATDTQCVSCGARLEWHRPGKDSIRAPQTPKVSAYRTSAGDRMPVRRRWLQVFESPWLQTSAYVLWMSFAVIVGFMVALAEYVLPPSLSGPLIVLCLLVYGGMTILMSRALADARDGAPFLLRLITERFGAHVEYAPWFFRLGGSAVIGYAIGYGCWAAFHSAWGSAIVGLLVGMGVWVWTWFVFSEDEE